MIRLSASSVKRFKDCPMKWHLARQVRRAEDTDALRMGTNFHAMMEAHDGGEDALAALYAAYEHCPPSKSQFDWAVECQTIHAMYLGHRWYWQDDPLGDTVDVELQFELPLMHPALNLPLPGGQRVGRIDRLLLRYDGRYYQHEYKTTSSDVSATSDYWNRLRMDTQVSFYDLALHEMGLDAPIGGAFYDVTRKPTIKPKFLTQAETQRFIVSAGEYHGEQFEIVQPDTGPIIINGWAAEIKQQKAGWQLRETPLMYRARLLDDMYERPEHYFARREVPRTSLDRAKFAQELFALYECMKHTASNGYAYRCEARCDDFGGCEYRGLCRNGLDPADLDDNELAAKGLTRITIGAT